MKLIVGLGNPGEKYKDNRHNVGHMFIDYLLDSLKKSTKNIEGKKMLHVTCYTLHNLILAKPLTFMNNSGIAVKKLITEYRLPTTNLVVIHDDLDIPLGKFKIQNGVGPQLHNGIESVEMALGKKDFWRVRIGVDNRQQTGWLDGESYVLQDFKTDEITLIQDTFPKIWSRISEEFLSGAYQI